MISLGFIVWGPLLVSWCNLSGFKFWIFLSICAAAAAKSLQSCPTLCNPIDCSPPGSPVPGILQARTLEWVVISFSNAWKWKVKVKLLSRVWLSDPMDCSLPGSSVHGIFQARVLEWVPLPSPQYMCSHYHFCFTLIFLNLLLSTHKDHLSVCRTQPGIWAEIVLNIIHR